MYIFVISIVNDLQVSREQIFARVREMKFSVGHTCCRSGMGDGYHWATRGTILYKWSIKAMMLRVWLKQGTQLITESHALQMVLKFAVEVLMMCILVVVVAFLHNPFRYTSTRMRRIFFMETRLLFMDTVANFHLCYVSRGKLLLDLFSSHSQHSSGSDASNWANSNNN